MLALQGEAAALQGEAAWAEERLLGHLWQSVPRNGRVHLHIVESPKKDKQGLNRDGRVQIGKPPRLKPAVYRSLRHDNKISRQ